MQELSDVAASQSKKHPINKVCQVLGMARSSYYFCAQPRPEGRFKQENARLRQEILRSYQAHDGVYGAPKIRQELIKLNLPFPVSEKRV